MIFRYPDSVLLIFCKAPLVGQVKTRLQPALSAAQAVDVHCWLTRMTLARAFREPLCAVHLYCAPNTGHAFFHELAAAYPIKLIRQSGADLGERMLDAFREALAAYRHVVLIGCDCPSLTVEDLQDAFTALMSGKDMVIAPAEDGGYVLIGMNAPHASLFAGITWGGDQVFAETLNRAADSSLLVHQLAQQWDVDTADDWYKYLRRKNCDYHPPG